MTSLWDQIYSQDSQPPSTSSSAVTLSSSSTSKNSTKTTAQAQVRTPRTRAPRTPKTQLQKETERIDQAVTARKLKSSKRRYNTLTSTTTAVSSARSRQVGNDDNDLPRDDNYNANDNGNDDMDDDYEDNDEYAYDDRKQRNKRGREKKFKRYITPAVSSGLSGLEGLQGLFNVNVDGNNSKSKSEMELFVPNSSSSSSSSSKKKAKVSTTTTQSQSQQRSKQQSLPTPTKPSSSSSSQSKSKNKNQNLLNSKPTRIMLTKTSLKNATQYNRFQILYTLPFHLIEYQPKRIKEQIRIRRTLTLTLTSNLNGLYDNNNNNTTFYQKQSEFKATATDARVNKYLLKSSTRAVKRRDRVLDAVLCNGGFVRNLVRADGGGGLNGNGNGNVLAIMNGNDNYNGNTNMNMNEPGGTRSFSNANENVNMNVNMSMNANSNSNGNLNTSNPNLNLKLHKIMIQPDRRLWRRRKRQRFVDSGCPSSSSSSEKSESKAGFHTFLPGFMIPPHYHTHTRTDDITKGKGKRIPVGQLKLSDENGRGDLNVSGGVGFGCVGVVNGLVALICVRGVILGGFYDYEYHYDVDDNDVVSGDSGSSSKSTTTTMTMISSKSKSSSSSSSSTTVTAAAAAAAATATATAMNTNSRKKASASESVVVVKVKPTLPLTPSHSRSSLSRSSLILFPLSSLYKKHSTYGPFLHHSTLRTMWYKEYTPKTLSSYSSSSSHPSSGSGNGHGNLRYRDGRDGHGHQSGSGWWESFGKDVDFDLNGNGNGDFASVNGNGSVNGRRDAAGTAVVVGSGVSSGVSVSAGGGVKSEMKGVKVGDNIDSDSSSSSSSSSDSDSDSDSDDTTEEEGNASSVGSSRSSNSSSMIAPFKKSTNSSTSKNSKPTVSSSSSSSSSSMLTVIPPSNLTSKQQAPKPNNNTNTNARARARVNQKHTKQATINLKPSLEPLTIKLTFSTLVSTVNNLICECEGILNDLIVVKRDMKTSTNTNMNKKYKTLQTNLVHKVTHLKSTYTNTLSLLSTNLIPNTSTHHFARRNLTSWPMYYAVRTYLDTCVCLSGSVGGGVYMWVYWCVCDGRVDELVDLLTVNDFDNNNNNNSDCDYNVKLKLPSPPTKIHLVELYENIRDFLSPLLTNSKDMRLSGFADLYALLGEVCLSSFMCEHYVSLSIISNTVNSGSSDNSNSGGSSNGGGEGGVGSGWGIGFCRVVYEGVTRIDYNRRRRGSGKDKGTGGRKSGSGSDSGSDSSSSSSSESDSDSDHSNLSSSSSSSSKNIKKQRKKVTHTLTTLHNLLESPTSPITNFENAHDKCQRQVVKFTRFNRFNHRDSSDHVYDSDYDSDIDIDDTDTDGVGVGVGDGLDSGDDNKKYEGIQSNAARYMSYLLGSKCLLLVLLAREYLDALEKREENNMNKNKERNMEKNQNNNMRKKSRNKSKSWKSNIDVDIDIVDSDDDSDDDNENENENQPPLPLHLLPKQFFLLRLQIIGLITDVLPPPSSTSTSTSSSSSTSSHSTSSSTSSSKSSPSSSSSSSSFGIDGIKMPLPTSEIEHLLTWIQLTQLLTLGNSNFVRAVGDLRGFNLVIRGCYDTSFSSSSSSSSCFNNNGDSNRNSNTIDNAEFTIQRRIEQSIENKQLHISDRLHVLACEVDRYPTCVNFECLNWCLEECQLEREGEGEGKRGGVSNESVIDSVSDSVSISDGFGDKWGISRVNDESYVNTPNSDTTHEHEQQVEWHTNREWWVNTYFNPHNIPSLNGHGDVIFHFSSTNATNGMKDDKHSYGGGGERGWKRKVKVKVLDEWVYLISDAFYKFGGGRNKPSDNEMEKEKEKDNAKKQSQSHQNKHQSKKNQHHLQPSNKLSYKTIYETWHTLNNEAIHVYQEYSEELRVNSFAGIGIGVGGFEDIVVRFYGHGHGHDDHKRLSADDVVVGGGLSDYSVLLSRCNSFNTNKENLPPTTTTTQSRTRTTQTKHQSTIASQYNNLHQKLKTALNFPQSFQVQDYIHKSIIYLACLKDQKSEPCRLLILEDLAGCGVDVMGVLGGVNVRVDRDFVCDRVSDNVKDGDGGDDNGKEKSEGHHGNKKESSRSSSSSGANLVFSKSESSSDAEDDDEDDEATPPTTSSSSSKSSSSTPKTKSSPTPSSRLKCAHTSCPNPANYGLTKRHPTMCKAHKRIGDVSRWFVCSSVKGADAEGVGLWR